MRKRSVLILRRKNFFFLAFVGSLFDFSLINLIIFNRSERTLSVPCFQFIPCLFSSKIVLSLSLFFSNEKDKTVYTSVTYNSIYIKNRWTNVYFTRHGSDYDYYDYYYSCSKHHKKSKVCVVRFGRVFIPHRERLRTRVSSASVWVHGFTTWVRNHRNGETNVEERVYEAQSDAEILERARTRRF